MRLKLRSLISSVVESIHVRMRKKQNRRIETDLMIVLRSGERRFVVEGRHLASEGDVDSGADIADGLADDWWADKKALSRLKEVGFGRTGAAIHFNPPWTISR